jgi:predicted dinucleotide-binding enzyme
VQDGITDRKEAQVPSTTISIIGLGSMAKAIAGRTLAGGHTVELIGRDAAKAADLAASLGDGVTAQTLGTTPVGDIVVLAVPYDAAVSIARQYGHTLAGKVVVDVSNTSAADASRLIVGDGTSGAEEIAKTLPEDTSVVKAFNTVFGHLLGESGPMDVLLAGDDADAKTSVSAFIQTLGLRPLDAGGLEIARWLEGIGLVMISLARNGVGTFNFSLGVDIRG